MRELTINQTEAVEKMKRLRVGALFMQCGTGKTQTACALINGIDDSDRLFWLAPCQTIENLREELTKCGLKYTPEIIGIESIGMSDRIYLEARERIAKCKRAIIVCDESLKIKNITAKRTKRLLEISKYGYYKLILNGTPITKNIIDIYAQMEFLSPRIFNATLYQFKHRYCIIAQKKKCGRVIKEWVKGFANIDHLLSVIEPYVFQCDLKLSVEKEHKIEHYFLDEKCSEEYQSLKYEMLEKMKEDKLMGTTILGYLQRMQQCYCCSEDKFKIVENLIDDKTVIFCKFIRSADALRERFKNATVLTYGKNSIGLNLQHCNKIIYFDKTFDYAFAEQSEYRIFRTGQKDNCIYYNLTGEVGLEKMLDDCIKKKVSVVQYFKQVGNKTATNQL